MSPEARDRADAYYAAAGSWADDRVTAIEASRRIAWIAAIIACLVALCLAVAIFLMLPLKTVVPYTLLVDRQTGYVQALDPIARSRIAPDAALTQSFLVQYVLAREGFDRATIQSDYRRVLLWSEGDARRDYDSGIQVSNPASPLVVLPRDTVIEARVRSVSSLGSGASLVRFETIRRDRGGAAQPPQLWASVVRYRYSDGPMSTEDRFLNPLGFTVTRYRRNAEVPPLEPTGPPSPALTNPASVTTQTLAQPGQATQPVQMPTAGGAR